LILPALVRVTNVGHHFTGNAQSSLPDNATRRS
jgi:hypothetical protein